MGIDCLKDLLRVAIDRLAVEQELTIFVNVLDECVSEEFQETVEHFEELGTAAISSQKQLRICSQVATIRILTSHTGRSLFSSSSTDMSRIYLPT